MENKEHVEDGQMRLHEGRLKITVNLTPTMEALDKLQRIYALIQRSAIVSKCLFGPYVETTSNCSRITIISIDGIELLVPYNEDGGDGSRGALFSASGEKFIFTNEDAVKVFSIMALDIIISFSEGVPSKDDLKLMPLMDTIAREFVTQWGKEKLRLLSQNLKNELLQDKSIQGAVLCILG
jgi:hypothetical protein